MASIVPLTALKSLFDASDSPEEYVYGFLSRMAKIMEDLKTQPVTELIQRVEQACEDRRQIFLIGNGGSAAVASHIVADLAPNTLVDGAEGFRAFCLADSVESITAIANDSGYENIFSYQLRCHLQPGDLVIALSVSGNSENVIRGIRYAKENGAFTVGMTGFDGGRLAKVCDLSIHIPTTRDEYGPVEDLFSCVGHLVTGYICMKRGRELAH